MNSEKTNKIHFYVALVLLICGALFKISWSPGNDVQLKKNLELFPVKIGGRIGIDVPLSERVLLKLGLTDYVNREYVLSRIQGDRRQTLPMSLYVGYYASQGKGKTYHSPKNCLPGSGWELTEIDSHFLNVKGERHKINKVLIQKGLEKQLVLYWFQDRGRIISSEYSAKIYLFLDSVTKKRSDGTFIRIMAPVDKSINQTLREEIEFAEAIVPLLKEHLPD